MEPVQFIGIIGFVVMVLACRAIGWYAKQQQKKHRLDDMVDTSDFFNHVDGIVPATLDYIQNALQYIEETVTVRNGVGRLDCLPAAIQSITGDNGTYYLTNDEPQSFRQCRVDYRTGTLYFIRTVAVYFVKVYYTAARFPDIAPGSGVSSHSPIVFQPGGYTSGTQAYTHSYVPYEHVIDWNERYGRPPIPPMLTPDPVVIDQDAIDQMFKDWDRGVKSNDPRRKLR